MATNTAGSKARLYHTDQVHYLAKTITFADDGKTITVGTLPAGAVVIPGLSGIAVNTIFNGGSTNTCDIGITGSTQKYASALALGTLGWIETDVVTVSSESSLLATADETIIATVVSTANASTGSAIVMIAYVLPDR